MLKQCSLLCLICLALTVCHPLFSSPFPPDDRDARVAEIRTMERVLLFFVNEERSRRSLRPFTFDGTLRLVALRHSRKMAGENRLSHDFPSYPELDSRLASSGVCFTASGENVSRGSDCTMRVIHEALMNSPNHRANILSSKFEEIGIGIEMKGKAIYVTQVFADLFHPKTSLEMENELYAGIRYNSRMNIPVNPSDNNPFQALCRSLASRYALDESPEDLTSSYPEDSITLIRFFQLDLQIIYTLVTTIKRWQNNPWGLGVAFERSVRHPGGIFALALFMKNSK